MNSACRLGPSLWAAIVPRPCSMATKFFRRCLLRFRLNNRTHRKLLVVDGRIAFTSGVGIAPQWTGQAQDPDHWRDTDFQVEGPSARRCKLRIIVPGEHIDSETVRRASRARWGDLLSTGAIIAEYQPTMFHCKVMIVDDLLVSVGSTNFDNRSFRLNDEATLNILDAGFANAQRLLERPMRERIGERLASLFRSQFGHSHYCSQQAKPAMV